MALGVSCYCSFWSLRLIVLAAEQLTPSSPRRYNSRHIELIWGNLGWLWVILGLSRITLGWLWEGHIGLVKNYFGSTLGHFGLVRITFGKLWVTLGHFGSTFVWVILSQIGSIWVTGLTLGQFWSIWISCKVSIVQVAQYSVSLKRTHEKFAASRAFNATWPK